MDISAPNSYADDFVSKINDLPSLGANVSELLVMLDSPHANFFKIAKLVRQDPVLSSKVLRVANSALYYSGMSLTSLETAMSRLGMNELRHIAMASSMMDTFFLVGNTMDIEAFWRHCLGSANASVLLARRAKTLSQAEKSNSSTFYTCGLLHHLGILLEAWVAPDRFKYALQISTARAIPFFQAEKEIFGFSHAESGAALLRRWKFPEVVVESALFHHDPEEFPGPNLNYTRVTHLSAMLCHGLEGQDSFEGPVQGFNAHSFFYLGLELADLPDLNKEFKEILEKTSKLAKDLI